LQNRFWAATAVSGTTKRLRNENGAGNGQTADGFPKLAGKNYLKQGRQIGISQFKIFRMKTSKGMIMILGLLARFNESQ
jgi:hypothetical protein